MRLIRRHGPLSRCELHQRMGLRPNTVGELAAAMLQKGLLREAEGENAGPGRPRQPLEVDASQRRVIGVAFEPGRVSACQLNLLGRRVGTEHDHATKATKDLVTAACALLESIGLDRALAIGISATGFVDPQTRSILTSSATFRQSRTSLDPIYAVAGNCPVLLENDMHALAACWQLNQDADPNEDVLLIELRDGAIGAALLVNGRPNRGCIGGGNELGHTRFLADTERCYCGQTGCLERICSSTFLRHLSGDREANLYARFMACDPGDQAMATVLRYLSTGIANIINFVRPNRVVLTGQLARCLPASNHLIRSVQEGLMAPLVDRVRIDLWNRPELSFAEAGAWLALAAVYWGTWTPVVAAPEPAEIPSPARSSPRQPASRRKG